MKSSHTNQIKPNQSNQSNQIRNRPHNNNNNNNTVHAGDDQGAQARAEAAGHAVQAAAAGAAGGHALHGRADQLGLPGRAAEPAPQEAPGDHPQAREPAQRGLISFFLSDDDDDDDGFRVLVWVNF